ncbi:dynein axonemal assembly factor 19-like [Amphiura filiformis]|uniref:dynein axonemal assembly factor 19-like n=1 Tax=Amphiura filiformis TaxID=82378 RepID=UPI003B20DAFF
MADLREDKIDFQKLERELEAAVETDAQYWRENDAKMRAVEQRVETYEQFKDMVAAAHIRPLDKEDKQGMLSTRNQPWNPYYRKTKEGNNKSVADDENLKKDLPVLPSNSNDFTKQWRKLKENLLKYNYLLDIGGDRLVKIFHAEISFGLLGDILSVLNQCLEPSHSEAVMHILTSLSETNRFSLSFDFLSKTEKTQCCELISKLENYCTGGDEEVGNVAGNGGGQDQFDGRLNDIGDKLNENSSNSKAETEEKKQDESDKNQQEVTLNESDNQGSDNQEIVSKETLERLKKIYKILPLGR